MQDVALRHWDWIRYNELEKRNSNCHYTHNNDHSQLSRSQQEPQQYNGRYDRSQRSSPKNKNYD
jgi:hypothetical protein